MKDLIKKILNEDEVVSKPYKFSEGGFLLPSNRNETQVSLTDDEFEKIKKYNDSCRELYQLHDEKLKLLSKHNKGVIQKLLKNLKSK